jgi:N utilization substance protein B
MNDLTEQSRNKAPSHYKRLGRELAMQFLFQNDMNGGDFDRALIQFWKQAELSGAFSEARTFRKGAKYAEKIIRGVMEGKEDIDSVIASFSQKWDMTRMACVDRNILRVAVYEMTQCPDIPPIVSIDEAVGIAKEFSSEKSGMFINGILNGVKDSLDRPARKAVDKI